MPATLAAIGAFVVKTIGVVGVYSSTALAVVGAATVVAGAVVAKKLIDNIYAVPNLDSDSSRQATVRGTVEPQKLIYGEALVSGPIAFVGVAGDENRDLYHAIVLAGHQSTAITDIHFDDKVITNAQIAANGQVTGGTFGPQNSVTICTIRKLLGTQTTADSVLDAAFGTINANEHIGTNLTYIVTKFTLTDESQEIWDKYLPQNIKALVKGKKIYDPRQDSTSTYYDASVGVATQRANDSTTWEWSENPVWCLVDYLTDDYFGMNIDLSRIDLAKAVDAADICDATATGGRVDQGDIDKPGELLAHGIEREGQPRALGLQQMDEGRCRGLALRVGEARAFKKIYQRDRLAPVDLALAAGGFQVLIAQRRIFRQRYFGVPLHERKLHRPTDLADDGNVLELILEKEAQKRHAPVQGHEQDQDVGPGLVIGDHQIVARRIERAVDLDAPVHRMHPTVEQRIAAHPAAGDPHAIAAGAVAQRAAGNQVQQHPGQHQREPENQHEELQNEGQDPDQRCRQQARHHLRRRAPRPVVGRGLAGGRGRAPIPEPSGRRRKTRCRAQAPCSRAQPW